ncbi:unnamed protein product [Closterium sp. Naga37s-1]|nr:unnamed protein product [Closterium sp. Naga37s-1]
MRSVPDRKRPQKMGSSRMDHGVRKCERLENALPTTKVPQEGGGELTTSVRVQTQDRKVLAELLAELETDCADPRDQDINDLTLAAQGEDHGVPREVVNNQQKVALAALSTDAGWAPHVHVESLQGSRRRGKRGGVRSGEAREAGKAETWVDQRPEDESACHEGVAGRGDPGGGATEESGATGGDTSKRRLPDLTQTPELTQLPEKAR